MREDDRRRNRPHALALLREISLRGVSVAAAAEATDRSERAVYRRAENDVPIEAWWLARLHREHVVSTEQWAAISGANDLGLVVTDPPAGDGSTVDTIVRAALRLGAMAGTVQRLVGDATGERSPGGSRIIGQEIASIRWELRGLMAAAQEIEQRLDLVLGPEQAGER